MTVSAHAAPVGSVSGVVRDTRGTPQIGALVELVNTDLAVIAQTFTDDHGRYALANVLPGVYGVKASASLFLPTLREDLRVTADSKMVVNLTLNTLYEAFRWLPARPRQADEPRDDWDWTLRLSANKPLLRMLQDGPLVVVSEGDGQNAALKARVTIRGGESQFGDGGIHHDFELRRLNDDTRQLILRTDLSQSGDTALNTEVGYEQQLGLGRTIRTVAAFVDRPEIAGGPDVDGMEAMIFRTAETMDLTPAVGLEAGGETEIVHMNTTQVASHPFASVHVRSGGDGVITYRVATTPGVQEAEMLDRTSTLSPEIAERNGKMLMEHGLHQELSFEQSSGTLRMEMTVFQDRVDNPLINGGGEISAADWKSGDLLYDSATGAVEVAGQNYSGTGVVGELKQTLPDDMWLSFMGGTGDALRMDALPLPVSVEGGLLSLRPHRAEMASAALGGKLQHGTEWRASYRWQQPDSLTAVDPFNKSLPDPYLSIYLRQPVHCGHVLPNGMEALVDVRNLLAEGYRPFVTDDGSVLYFAQASRAVEGGLSFSF